MHVDHIWVFELSLPEKEADSVVEALEEENFSRAIDVLQKNVAQLEDVEPGIYADIGYLQIMLNDYQNALRSYTKSTQKIRDEAEFSGSPGFANVLLEYSVVLDEHHMLQEELAALLEAEKIFKNHFIDEENPKGFHELQEEINELKTRINN